MNNNGLKVLQFLITNANSAIVIEAIDSVSRGKYYAPEDSLLKRVQPKDLFCYTTIGEIAESINLRPASVRYHLKILRQKGVIEAEQLWGIFSPHTAGEVLISAREAEFRMMNGGEYGEDLTPCGNLYLILKPNVGLLPRGDIMSTWPEQLTLPFPPSERTILAHGARLQCRKFEKATQSE